VFISVLTGIAAGAEPVARLITAHIVMNVRPSNPQSNPADSCFALYVHWPFCLSKCPYCDFNSHVRDSVDQAAWRAALIADLVFEAQWLPNRKLGSIFFGGGTPSLMPPSTVAAIIDQAARLWPMASDCEITLEANPSSVEAAKFADLSTAGINRTSLGLQALDDDALHFLGRAHSVSEGLSALDLAQSAFDRVNFDLIYARPNQSVSDWDAELKQALSFGTEHLSLYQLTIEEGTRFASLVTNGSLLPIDSEEAATLFELTRERTRAAGKPAYEVSNHARPGAESRHNLTYWRYGDYLGIGPGAHGRRNGAATSRHKKPENFLRAVSRNGHGLQEETALTVSERAKEALVMGLRLAEGVDLNAINTRTGIAELIDDRAAQVFEAHGLLERNGHRLTITEAGMLVLDRILADIVTA
jgi:putative oxygen-independent coproporphyrinogen III oxidase